MPTDAKKFYGAAFTEARADHLTKAVRYLDMAIRGEESGEMNKVDMAFKAALKAEGEAFAIA